MINQTEALPLAWVEKIFKKLTLAYGRDFTARWEGIETADVIEDWSHELAGFANWPEAISYALQHLPAGKPPTVFEFRAICYLAPKPNLPALPEPAANPAFAKQVLSKVSRAPSQASRYTDWIHAGLADLQAGVKRSPTVERMIREAARAKGMVAA